MKVVLEIKEQAMIVVAGKYSEKKGLTLSKAFRIDFDAPILNGNRVVMDQAAQNQFKQALRDHKLSIKKANFVINNKIALVRDLTIPKVDKKKKARLVENELSTLFNLHHDYVIDYRDIGTAGNSERVIAVALAEETIESLVVLCAALKIKIEGIDASVSALIMFLQKFNLVPKVSSSLVIDISDSYIRNYLFMNGEFVLFRTFYIQAEATIDHVTRRLHQIIDVLQQQHLGDKKQSISEIILLGNQERFPFVKARYEDQEDITVHEADLTKITKKQEDYLDYGNAFGGLL